MQSKCIAYPEQQQDGQRPAGRLQGCSGAAGAAAKPQRLPVVHPGRSLRPVAAAGAAYWTPPCCSSQGSVGQGLAAAVREAALLRQSASAASLQQSGYWLRLVVRLELHVGASRAAAAGRSIDSRLAAAESSLVTLDWSTGAGSLQEDCLAGTEGLSESE